MSDAPRYRIPNSAVLAPLSGRATRPSRRVEPDTAGATGLLRRQVIHGVGWKLASQVVLQGTKTVVGVFLAHLLLPGDYGLAVMALVLVGVAPIFSDLSLGAALIQRRELTENDRSTAFWTTIVAGGVCTAAGIASAPLVGRVFATPEVAPLFAVASLSFIISATSATQIALLTREMRFRSLQLREMVASCVGGIAAVIAAIAGLGAWAIVLQVLTSEVVGLVLVWRFSPWRPHFLYSLASLRDLGSFAGSVTGARMLGYLNLNADTMLIARFLGAGPLGIYALAYNVMFAPFARLATPIHQVLFPAFARLAPDGRRVGAVWLRGNRLGAALACPAFVGLSVVAPDFVPVVLGERWSAAVPVLQLLCVAGFLQTLQSLNHSVLQALGRGSTLLRFMLFSTTVTVSAFAIGLEWGIVGVAAGFAVARAVAVSIFAIVVCRVVLTPVGAFLRSIRRILFISLAMGVLAWTVRLLLEAAGVSPALRLPVVVAVGAVTYLALLAWLERPLLVEVRELRSPNRA